MNFKKFVRPLIAGTALLGLTGTFSSCATVTRVNAKTVHKHDVITPGKSWSKYVSFPHIINTGKVTSTASLGQVLQPNYKIDFSKDDAFIRALITIERETSQKIKNDYNLSFLLNKSTWDKQDRIYWERHVSKIISKEFQETKGLSTYRNKGTKRHPSLNTLSIDINNNTKTIEYDCEAMAITEGIVLQKIEDKFLPQPRDNSKLKQATKYYYISGFCWDKGEAFPGGHAFIMSNATGNIIEGTKTESPFWHDSPYFVVANSNYSIANFIKGEPAVAVNPETGMVRSYQKTLSGHHAYQAVKKYKKTTDGLISAYKKRLWEENSIMHTPFRKTSPASSKTPSP